MGWVRVQMGVQGDRVVLSLFWKATTNDCGRFAGRRVCINRNVREWDSRRRRRKGVRIIFAAREQRYYRLLRARGACAGHGTGLLPSSRPLYWSRARFSRRRAACRRLAATSCAVADDAIRTGSSDDEEFPSRSSCCRRGRSTAAAAAGRASRPPQDRRSPGGHVGSGYVVHRARPMHSVRRHSCCMPSFRTHLQPTISRPPRNSNSSKSFGGVPGQPGPSAAAAAVEAAPRRVILRVGQTNTFILRTSFYLDVTFRTRKIVHTMIIITKQNVALIFSTLHGKTTNHTYICFWELQCYIFIYIILYLCQPEESLRSDRVIPDAVVSAWRRRWQSCGLTRKSVTRNRSENRKKLYPAQKHVYSRTWLTRTVSPVPRISYSNNAKKSCSTRIFFRG